MWIALVNVYRKWRDVVFRSSRRLNLQLLCTDTKCAGEMEDIWPHVKFPIVVSGFNRLIQDSDADEIIAALEHNDRVHRIKRHHSSSFHMQEVLVAMQNPFPAALTDLALEFELSRIEWHRSFLVRSWVDLHRRVYDHYGSSSTYDLRSILPIISQTHNFLLRLQ